MLNFNGWKIGFIITICRLGIIYALPNFFNNLQRDGDQPFLPGKTINLGLDLQGGSYLLLEADINSVLNERLEAVNEDVLRAFKEYEIVSLNKILSNKKLTIEFESKILADKAKKVLRQSLGSDFKISSSNSNNILIEYSELATIKLIDLTIEQAIEIVRKRIDETEEIASTYAKDIVKIEKGTDKATSYGDVFHQKDSDKRSSKPIKQQRSQTVLKVDLHIELLTSNYHYMDNFEIVQLQLTACYEQLPYAMNSKITKVEIVHGIGEGILRSEVHQILKNYKLRYYLSKNGGSTEVML